jgi:hypothetical protein
MMTSKSKNTETDFDPQAESEAIERLEALKKETIELEAQLARGTRDVTVEAKRVTTLEARIELALRARPMSLEELARDVKEAVGRVSAALKPMRKRLYNAGTDSSPAWFWVVGDSASTGDVNAAVAALVRYKPMRFPELLAATGARQGRVSGAIVALQRDPKGRLVNLDTAMRARWFSLPDDVSVSRLKRR